MFVHLLKLLYAVLVPACPRVSRDELFWDIYPWFPCWQVVILLIHLEHNEVASRLMIEDLLSEISTALAVLLGEFLGRFL